jgi:hypothetical protein
MRILALLFAFGCGQAVDDEILRDYPIAGYEAWAHRVDVTGKAPGHADSYRIIYANDLAVDPTQSFRLGYQEGAIFVKEIRDNNGGMPGDLRYIAVMRRVGEIEEALENEGGWLYTQASDVNATEKEFAFCWSRCHVAAPYNGAWYDYRD